MGQIITTTNKPAIVGCRLIGLLFAPKEVKMKSEDIGRCIGLMTRRVEGQQFHRHRVGRLSREVQDIHALIAFRNYVIEKLAWQQHLYPNVEQAIRDSSRMIVEGGRYDKQAFLSGFFATYYRDLDSHQWPPKGKGLS